MSTRHDPVHDVLVDVVNTLAVLIREVLQVAWWLVRRPRILIPVVLVGALVLTRLWSLLLIGGAVAVGMALIWRIAHPESFRRHVNRRLSGGWRAIWWYRRRWKGVLRQTRLVVRGVDDDLVPTLKRVQITPTHDRLLVGLVPGQSPDDFDRSASALAHAFGGRGCRVFVEAPGWVTLEFARADALRVPVEPLPIAAEPDLHAVPVGRREDGDAWSVKLLGTHVLIAGVTGAGKGSVIWSLLWGIAPRISEHTVEVWAIDPKGGMELGLGERLFTRFESDAERVAGLLDEAVTLMKQRAARLAGRTRQHQPTPGDPILLVLIDEVANLTAYLPDRKLRERISQSLAVLLTQGRAVGVNVVAALQDPRKEVLSLRNLFPTRVALRLDEPSQVDMVLGDGARLAGARCDEISELLPGVGFVKVDGQREPVRVRAAYLTDDDIREVAQLYAAPREEMAA